MLVLTRKEGEAIRIGDNIEIVVRRLSGNRVALSVEAPRNVRILRGELTQFDDSACPGGSDRSVEVAPSQRRESACGAGDYAIVEGRIPRAYFHALADEFIS